MEWRLNNFSSLHQKACRPRRHTQRGAMLVELTVLLALVVVGVVTAVYYLNFSPVAGATKAATALDAGVQVAALDLNASSPGAQLSPSTRYSDIIAARKDEIAQNGSLAASDLCVRLYRARRAGGTCTGVVQVGIVANDPAPDCVAFPPPPAACIQRIIEAVGSACEQLFFTCTYAFANPLETAVVGLASIAFSEPPAGAPYVPGPGCPGLGCPSTPAGGGPVTPAGPGSGSRPGGEPGVGGLPGRGGEPSGSAGSLGARDGDASGRGD